MVQNLSDLMNEIMDERRDLSSVIKDLDYLLKLVDDGAITNQRY